MDDNTRAFIKERIENLGIGILKQKETINKESNPWTRLGQRDHLNWLTARREEAEFILGILERAEG